MNLLDLSCPSSYWFRIVYAKSILGILLATAILFGAFGAHALKKILPPDQIHIFQTANQYHFYLGFFFFILSSHSNQTPFHKNLTQWTLIGGLIFVISLYGLVLLNLKWLGAITPIGGIILILVWATYACKNFKR